jgi:hypothetical protein
VGTPLPPCTPVAPGMISWWRAENNANDIAGRNNGTAVNLAYAPAEVGQGFRFSGGTNYVEIPDSSSLRPATLTVEAWVKFDSLASLANRLHDDHYIVSREFLRDNGLYGPSFVLGKVRSDVQEGDHIFFDIGNTNGSTRIVDGGVPVVTNQWYHVAATFDGTTLKLYRNGVLTRSSPWPQSLLGSALLHYDKTPLRIGKIVRDFDEGRFQGMADEVALYNRALSDAEINALYNAGVSGKCPGTEPVFLAGQQNGGTVILSWPLSRSEVRLETSQTLKPPQWVPANNSVSIIGERRVITITPTAGQTTRFFRLAPGP